MKTNWRFSIYTFENASVSVDTIGVITNRLDDMRRFGSIVGHQKEIKVPCSIDVCEPEGSPRLHELVRAIQEVYGFEPSEWRVVPADLQNKYFGVRKERQYSQEDLSEAEFLTLLSFPKRIADRDSGCDEPNSGPLEIVAEKYRPEASVSIGWLFPFPVYAMTKGFKDLLLSCDLKDFVPTPVTGADLWRLTSSIILPKSLLRLQDEAGNATDPDDWGDKFALKVWDDRGYLPHELTYRREELAPLLPFDIALSYERVGNARHIAFREIIVSQRFRRVMDELGQKGIEYAPVRLL